MYFDSPLPPLFHSKLPNACAGGLTFGGLTSDLDHLASCVRAHRAQLESEWFGLDIQLIRETHSFLAFVAFMTCHTESYCTVVSGTWMLSELCL